MEFIECIQQYRSPWVDLFFKFLNYFDRPEFLFVLIPILWLSISWKWGLRIFYILALSGIANNTLKAIFAHPRPFQLDPKVGIIHGYSFPSGAAQTVMLLSLILITYWKNRWKWAVAFVYIFFISLSRVYLGVHFPIDILAGWTVGFCLWLVFIYGFPPIEEQLKTWPRRILWPFALCAPLLLLFLSFFVPTFGFEGFFSAAFGLSAGLILSYKYHWILPPVRGWEKSIFRSITGIIGVFCIAYLFSYLNVRGSVIKVGGSIEIGIIRNIFIGLWVSGATPWILYPKSPIRKLKNKFD
jgi:undecaprenyl-diphosphatase